MEQEPVYEIIPCLTAGNDLIAGAKAEFQPRLNATEKISEHGYVWIGWGPKCEALFHHGLDVSFSFFLSFCFLFLVFYWLLTDVKLASNEIILRECGPYDQAEKDSAVIMFAENNTQLPHFKATPDLVMVFRPFDNILNSENGFFKITKGRNVASSLLASQIDHLQLNQVLVLDGNVEICYPLPGGGLCMLHGIKKQKRDLHIKK